MSSNEVNTFDLHLLENKLIFDHQMNTLTTIFLQDTHVCR